MKKKQRQKDYRKKMITEKKTQTLKIYINLMLNYKSNLKD